MIVKQTKRRSQMKNEREGKKTPPEKDSESTDADGHKKVDEQLEHAYAFYFAYGERLTAMIHYQYLLKRPGPEIFHALADSIGIGTLSGFQMYVTRDGIPFVKSVPNDKTKIRGEVFAITRENYRVLAALRKGGAVLGFPSLQNFDLENKNLKAMTSKGGTFINGALVAVGLMSTNGATRIDHGNYLLYIHHKYLPGVPRIPTFSDTFDASLDSNDAPKHDFTPGSRGNIKRSGKNKTRRASGDGKNEPVQRPRLPDRPRSASRPDRREWGNTSLRSNPFYGLEKRRLSGTNFQYKSTTEDKSGTRPKADSVNTTGTAAKAGSSSGLETSEKDALQRKNENYTKDEGASETGTSSKAVVQGMIWDSLTAVLTKRTKAAVSDITGCNKESDVKNGIWTSSTASAAPVESGCSNKNEVQDSVATSSNDGNEDSSGVDSKDSMKHIRESDFKAAASDGSEKDSRKECKIDITDTDGRECTMDMADKNGGGSKADASSEREGTGGNGGSIDEQAEALAASLVDVWIAGRERNEDSALLANNLVQAMEDAISDLKAKQNGETCQKAASKAE